MTGAVAAVARWAAAALAALCLCGGAGAQDDPQLSGRALIDALREGGFNIYFRHAPTSWSQSDNVEEPADWKSCDPARMRQLSDAGRETARALGESLRALDIPVGRVLASPYCRTVETARLLDLGPVETSLDILNMRAAHFVGGPSKAAERARRRLGTPPAPGTNTVLVAHGNVLRAAAQVYTGEAGAVVFEPRGEGAFSVVGRVTPEQWRALGDGAP